MHIQKQNVEGLLNRTSNLKDLKSLINQVYQKESPENIKKKNDINDYFREEISEK